MLPQGPNQRWSLDFLHDQLSDGRRFRILAIVDDFTRECLCLVADTSLSGLRVGRELDAIIASRGKPAGCVSDNGSELTSMAMLRWSQDTCVEGTTSPPAGRNRTPSLRASTAACVTSSSTKRCSGRWAMPGLLWPRGSSITTPSGHTAASAICRRPTTPSSASRHRNGTGRCAQSGAPRPAPLQHPAKQAQMVSRLYASPDERRGSGQMGCSVALSDAPFALIALTMS
jgi:hypothetical protein